MGLADVHAHLTLPQNAAIIDELIANAEKAGVTTIITNAISAADNRAVSDLAERFALVKPAFGIHPVETVPVDRHSDSTGRDEQNSSFSVDAVLDWIRDNIEKGFAVGEIGLDGHWVPERLWEKQEQVFTALLDLALEAEKPVIIHSRKRERRTFEILAEKGIKRVIWHCFGGKLKLAKRIAERGHYLSIPANARRSKSFTAMLTSLPRELILFETDCPYLSPERGRNSQPADVALTRAYTAELWSASETEVEERLAENFTRLFGVEP
ncbi:MAG: TatD family hydrolase [Deltaproteobacteria bacterium]|nr:TatD family hydrolase [Deltaproteobacteria bacterium]